MALPPEPPAIDPALLQRLLAAFAAVQRPTQGLLPLEHPLAQELQQQQPMRPFDPGYPQPAGRLPQDMVAALQLGIPYEPAGRLPMQPPFGGRKIAQDLPSQLRQAPPSGGMPPSLGQAFQQLAARARAAHASIGRRPAPPSHFPQLHQLVGATKKMMNQSPRVPRLY